VQDVFGVSERRGCAALRFHRSCQYYRARRDSQAHLQMRISEIAAVLKRSIIQGSADQPVNAFAHATTWPAVFIS
jgi:hypothetical protein